LRSVLDVEETMAAALPTMCFIIQGIDAKPSRLKRRLGEIGRELTDGPAASRRTLETRTTLVLG
jgi:hypothetical protein